MRRMGNLQSEHGYMSGLDWSSWSGLGWSEPIPLLSTVLCPRYPPSRPPHRPRAAPHHKKVHNSPRPALRPPAGQTCWVLEKWIVWSLLFLPQHHCYRLQPRARFYGNWAGQGPVSGADCWVVVCVQCHSRTTAVVQTAGRAEAGLISPSVSSPQAGDRATDDSASRVAASVHTTPWCHERKLGELFDQYPRRGVPPRPRLRRGDTAAD